MDIFNLKYYIIYSVFAITAFIFAMYVDFKKKQYNNISRFIAAVFFILIALLFGFRGEEIGSDTEMYKWQFMYHANLDFGIQFIFKYLIVFVHVFTDEAQYFLVAISLFYVLFIFWSINVFLKSFESNFLLIAFSFVSLFFFLALGINIIRQGVSLALVLLAVSYYFKDNKNIKSWLIPFIIAIGFHSATAVILILFIIIVLIRKVSLNYYYIWYFLLLGISALGGSILSFGSFLNYLLVIDSKRSDFYVKGEGAGEYVIGFKAQFVAFNTIFLIIFSLINHKLLKNENENYKLLLKYYLSISGVFFMMFQIPFSDRWGIMSWVMIPFLIAPLFSINNTSRLGIFTVLFLIFVFVFFNIYNS
ncbi:EpsG family protein [Chryseobacterium daecheongense]|uniref:EpsG family protein n=1 Tax=Chryseobacterium daecheongense TaxID=192389 RepID=A0A3N0W683_9FLAO|nr:EpsG family protein [Chryseobacterium daecheongense]ROI00523.1 EpsG family protein [Chryseobacterium daecheongense]TDX94501.1 EpsG-like putative glucosyltransferase [Chryseobacterium daecheongense]